MPEQIMPLMQVLVEIPDFRCGRGKRHPLSAILGMACAAILCGYRSYGAIAEWGRNYGWAFTRALGFTRADTPCAATLHTVLKRIDVMQLEAKLQAWVESVYAALPAAPGELEGIAGDGKVLRGSRKQGAPGAHVLSLLGHRLGLTFVQQGVPDDTNEIPVMHHVLHNLILAGRVVTADAQHTQPPIAQAILDAGGDYVMPVKKNQPQVYEDVATLFQESRVVADTLTDAQQTDFGHGRTTARRLTASTALVGYTDWPGVQQVFRLERQVTTKKSGKRRREVVYGITSLPPERADAEALLQLSRQHWHIENKSHWVRDVTLDEDRSQVRCGHIPHVMATLRNVAIGLMRLNGETNIAAACRRFAAQPWQALALLGVYPDN